MGVNRLTKNINNEKISDLRGFDKKLIKKIYNNNLPDFSEMEKMDTIDSVVEGAYSLAAMDNRSFLTEKDLISAITKINMTDSEFEDLYNKLDLQNSLIPEINNMKIIKKTGTTSNIIVEVNKKDEVVTPKKTSPKPNNSLKSGLDQSIKNTLEGYLDNITSVDIINNIVQEGGGAMSYFLGHNTQGTSNKYYFAVKRMDNKVAAFWGGVGKHPQNKIYEPYEKSFHTLIDEKKRKGYRSIVEK